MPRHIHIPTPIDWGTFLANSAEIDNYLVSQNELLRVRYAPAPRRLALALTDSCNALWDFVVSDETPQLVTLAERINALLVEGAVAEGVINDTNLTPARRDNPTTPYLDKKTHFLYSDVDQTIRRWEDRFHHLDVQAGDFLNRKWVSAPFQRELADFSWLAQYQLAYWCPFNGLNGMTGRLLTNALRLRWSMTLWPCDLKKSAWWENSDMYSKIWLKKDSLLPIDPSVRPNLEKPQFLSQ